MSELAKQPGEPLPLVITWLTEGQREADIIEAVRHNWPKADPSELLAAAVDHFEQAANASLAVVVGWALTAYRELYRRQLDGGDYAGALRAIKELTALAGQYLVSTEEAENDAGE